MFAIRLSAPISALFSALSVAALVVVSCSGCAESPTIALPCGDSLTVPLSDELLAQLGGSAGVAPPCRAAATGEVVINEVGHKPAGKDLDADGKSNGRDELIEVVSLAHELVHLLGTRVVFGGKVRGEITHAACMAPYTAAVLVGSTTGAVKLPLGAQLIRLNKTLRLTDSGGALALVGVAGTPLDQVAVPLARDATEGVVTRQIDAARDAPLVPHATLPHADGSPWSPGTCADGESFPACVVEGVVDREAALRDPRAP